MATRGIIYSAFGDRYLAEAVASARSSMRFNQIPHLIFCDRPCNDRTEHVNFRQFETAGDPYLDKINSIRNSPFEHTLYLDTDTYVTANVEELFGLLRRFDLAFAHAPGYMKGPDQGQSEAFCDFNAGVIVYRASPNAKAVLDNWKRLFQQWAKSPPFQLHKRDQHSFRRAVWESEASLYVLPPEYNCRIIFPGKLVGTAKILHGHADDYEETARTLNAIPGPRAIVLSYEPTPGVLLISVHPNPDR